MLTAQAAGTQVKPFRLPIKNDRGWLYIGQPAPSGMLLRVAYSVTEVYCLATDIAFSSQIVNSFSKSETCSTLLRVIFEKADRVILSKAKNLETLRRRSG